MTTENPRQQSDDPGELTTATSTSLVSLNQGVVLAGKTPPPSFTYIISALRGASFSWNGEVGHAVYFDDHGSLVRQEIAFEKQVADPKPSKYWAFYETLPTADNKKRWWLFETEPRPNEARCSIYYYYPGQDPIPFGMAWKNLPEPIPNGTWVKIVNSGFGPSKVVEYRGPLGPKGARVYRVRFRKKPPGYTEVLEEQLEILPEKATRKVRRHDRPRTEPQGGCTTVSETQKGSATTTQTTQTLPEPGSEPIPNGTWVKIIDSGFGPSMVVEYRGPLGPKGARVYGVLYRQKPPGYTEVLEEQLEILPPK